MEIGKLIEGAAMVRFIKARIIKWLGHVQRMNQARPDKKLLDWKPMGMRPVGRPRQRWQEDVMEDLEKLKVKNWKETGKHIRTWRDPQRVTVPNDDEDDDDDDREQCKITKMSKLREKEYRLLCLVADGTTGLLSALELR